jgi:hypothetical protein
VDHDAICDLFSFLADLAINAVFPEHPNAHHAFQVFPTWKGGWEKISTSFKISD